MLCSRGGCYTYVPGVRTDGTLSSIRECCIVLWENSTMGDGRRYCYLGGGVCCTPGAVGATLAGCTSICRAAAGMLS
jgi:hypothetical protein